MTKNKFQLFCDMDGVLVDYMGGVLPTMNNFVAEVAAAPNRFRTEKPGLYKAAKKAVAEMGGDLDAGLVGAEMKYHDVGKGTEKKKVRSLMYTLVSNNYKWWVNLDWMPDGRELWEYIKPFNPIILTGPQGPNSKLAKKAWVLRELGLGKDRVIVTHTKHEEARPFLDKGVTPVLIDDLPKYVVPFRNVGGIAIHHANTEQTIAELQALGF